MRKFLLGLALATGIGFSTFAQETVIPSSPIDLETAVKIALENNLTLKRSELNQLTNEATLLQNQGQRYPNFTTGASSGYRWGRSINPVTNLFETARIGNINVSASSNATIFAGNQINNSIKQSKVDLEAGMYNIEATKNDITLNIINLFINVVFNREQVNVAENQLLTTKDQLTRTTKLVDAGSLPLSDQLDVQAQNATNQVNLVNAKNNYNIAKLNLAQALQIPYTLDFSVIEPKFEINESLMATETPKDIYQIAIETMPEIKAAQANILSSEYGVKLAKAGYFPTLGIGANIFSNYVDQSFGRERPTFGQQIDNNLSEALNLQLSIPLFSRLNNKANVQRARVQKQISEVAALEAENQLRNDIETAYNSALAAQLTYESSLVQVQSLKETFRISQQRFDLGAINSVDFQVAQNNLFNAQADLLNAKYTYIFRVKVLDFYLGNPINLN
ncbi:TolC family protein [Algoriphagus antarcticus]|uniref:Outer membrane protein n=1 Tax=Algoriphagus antarcticus TaxID=238540 RepID=A0A3E0E8K7_9BACT|nr:TolC family protein [Algoriphagus antarcticus]REG94594.1 outer membrane protein [Algoriphagus antarcticus]